MDDFFLKLVMLLTFEMEFSCNLLFPLKLKVDWQIAKRRNLFFSTDELII